METNLSDYYKDLILKKSPDFHSILKALKITENFIRSRKKILAGGQSIDYALKSKGDPGIYEIDTLPDFDIISETYFQDAYNLSEVLYRAGFREISVINALHPSTMRVRINFTTICDITYVPYNIIKIMPTIWYKGIQLIHPHVTMIDQHRAFSYPYENAPFETTLHRPVKDMPRYDLLYKYYPLRLLYPIDDIPRNNRFELINITIPFDIIDDQCISGIAALNYWVQDARSLGFQTNTNLGNSFKLINIADNTSKTLVDFQLPLKSNLISLYSNNIEALFNKIKHSTENNYDNERFYNRYLDKLPRSIRVGAFEIFDNSQMITAHTVDIGNNITIHIADMQHIMLYLLTTYILTSKTQVGKRNYVSYMGYLLCRDIISWASSEYKYNLYDDDSTKLDESFKKKNKSEIERNNKIKRFLPTANTYGTINNNDSKVVATHKFNLQNRTKDPSDKYKYDQPKHIYDRDLSKGRVPRHYYKFNIEQSEIYNNDGKKTTPFV